MKKGTSILVLILLVILSSGCSTNNSEEILTIKSDDIITMENLDLYLFRDDVQYVDLRNFSARFVSGYIDGFENIPFFDYLDYRVFDRNDGYDFQPDQLLNSTEIERLFKRDKAIFLYADGCIRSGYIKDILDYLGYERVFVIGGFFDYQGDHLIIGTGEFEFGTMFASSYYSTTTGLTYYVYGEYDLTKTILSIRFDIVDEQHQTLRGTDYDPNIDYNTQLTILENFIVSEMINFNQLYVNSTNVATSGYDQIPLYTLGFSEDLISLIESLVVK